MTKIQIISRKDGTNVCVLYFPADVARDMSFVKGDTVTVEYDSQQKAVVVKRTQ